MGAFARMIVLAIIFFAVASFIEGVRADEFSLDPNFRPVISGTFDGQLTGALSMAVQTNGQVIVVGSFTSVDGKQRNGVARLNADGVLDDEFDAGMGPNSAAWCVAVDGQGRILVGGEFSTWNGNVSGPLVRLLPNGDLDGSFALNGPSSIIPDAWLVIFDVEVEEGDSVILAGAFTHFQGAFQPFLARATDTGALDDSYAPEVDNLVISIQRSERVSGGIYIAGGFGEVSGAGRPAAALLDASGILDGQFSPQLDANDLAWDIAETALGNVYVGGDVSGLLRRFNSNGASDDSFNVQFTQGVDYYVATLLPWSEKVFVGGYFDGVGGVAKSCLALINEDGTVNAAFGATGANDGVNKLAYDTAGNLLVAGLFSTLDGESRTGIARYIKTIPEIRIGAPTLVEGQIQFSFFAEAGKSYVLQSTAEPPHDWVGIRLIPGIGAETNIVEAITVSQKYFRVSQF